MTYPIRPYNPQPVACHPHDSQAPEVARILRDLIRSVLPRVEVEQFGSTAVPGCSGKGYIDLMILYDDGMLETTKVGLSALGFQPQTSRDPFPEERPMRVGSFTYDGKEYSIHAHVIALNSPEVEGLRRFREMLKADVRLRAEYESEKQLILATGVVDQVDYANRKGLFVSRVLGK